jgi:hypothetical protein
MIKVDGWCTKMVCCITTVTVLTWSVGPVFAQDSTRVTTPSKATGAPQTTTAPQPDTVSRTTTAPQSTSASQTPTVLPKKKDSASFDDYLRGKMDGRQESKGGAAWILAGLTGTGFCLLIGVAGIGIALLCPSSPSESALMGKSTYYITGYTEAYKSKSRMRNATFASVGCLMAALINIIINVSSGNATFNQ